MVRPLGEAREIFSTTTNESGAFETAELPAGWYQVEACLDGFDSAIVPVEISSHAAPTEQIDIHLRASA